jgi:DNA-binding MarR family transcriptional regulator
MIFVIYEFHSSTEVAVANRERRRLVTATKRALRDLRIELSVLNHRVGNRVELKDIDFDCFDVIVRHGPVAPSVLARRVGVHLATMTGILDRLEAGGWITRERLADDRRGIRVRSLPDRQRELLEHFAGMNTAMDKLCDNYTDDQLEVIVDFLQRTTEAGRVSSGDLGTSPAPERP